MELDRLDYKLLTAIQTNNRLTADALSEIAGLSATACQRRLKRLREAGIIESDVAIVSPSAVGRPLMMIVHVSLERERADIVDRFKTAIRRTPEILSGYYVTGEADFVLLVSARSMEEYEAFTRDFFYENRDIRGFKTMVVMDRVKASFALPLHLDEPAGNEKRATYSARSALIEATRAPRPTR
jgi:Lrp/AsnC family leucine-responsive transcriptional regulator